MSDDMKDERMKGGGEGFGKNKSECNNNKVLKIFPNNYHFTY